MPDEEWIKKLEDSRKVKFIYQEQPKDWAFITAQIEGDEVVYMLPAERSCGRGLGADPLFNSSEKRGAGPPSFFMNRFRKLGYIKYNGGLSLNSSLLRVVLHD
jgi:hypothetical protein